MNILGTEIRKGSSHTLNLGMAKLYTNTKIDVPVIIERSKKDGPTLLITAGLHGDEVNGVEIVRQVISDKINKTTSGTVICIPLINVFGFLNKTRYFPDGRDLNRVFPGSKSGSLASRFAFALMNEVIPHVDFILDFHTGGAQRFNMTQLRIATDKATLEMAKKLSVPFVLHSDIRKETFRESCSKLGKKVFLFEGGKAMFLDKKVTTKGVETAKYLIQEIGLHEFGLTNSTPPTVFTKTKWVRASKSGMFRSVVNNGILVKKGDIIGSLSDPYGKQTTKIRASVDGNIICLNHLPLVNQGDALFNIGVL